MNNSRHTLTLDSRSFLKVTAVDDVISFDETSVSLAIGETTLNISGDDLQIKNLSLENGEVSVSGNITAVVYFDEAPRRRKFGIFGR